MIRLHLFSSTDESLKDEAIRPWVQLALIASFVQLRQFHFFVQCSRLISVFAFVSRHICFKRSLAQVITLVAEWIDTYGIHHCRIFRSSYRKLAWVGFEPTTTILRWDALTDWAIRPWVQLALRYIYNKCKGFAKHPNSWAFLRSPHYLLYRPSSHNVRKVCHELV